MSMALPCPAHKRTVLQRVRIREVQPSAYSVGCTAGVAVPVSEGLIVFFSPGIIFG
jgi:hypothetical protein